jgi:hypothetical protein
MSWRDHGRSTLRRYRYWRPANEPQLSLSAIRRLSPAVRPLTAAGKSTSSSRSPHRGTSTFERHSESRQLICSFLFGSPSLAALESSLRICWNSADNLRGGS